MHCETGKIVPGLLKGVPLTRLDSSAKPASLMYSFPLLLVGVAVSGLGVVASLAVLPEVLVLVPTREALVVLVSLPTKVVVVVMVGVNDGCSIKAIAEENRFLRI